MTNKEAIEYFKDITINMPLMEGFKANDAVKLAIKALQNQINTLDNDKWIPIIFEYDSESKMYMIKGVIPSDGESIIVTDGKSVWDDTFIRDGIECYLDSGHDIGISVIAWQPYPNPYIPKINESKNSEIDYNNLIAGVIDATKITIISSGATCSNCAQAKGDIKKICDNKKSEEYTNFVADNMTCNNHQLKTEGADGHRR